MTIGETGVVQVPYQQEEPFRARRTGRGAGSGARRQYSFQTRVSLFRVTAAAAHLGAVRRRHRSRERDRRERRRREALGRPHRPAGAPGTSRREPGDLGSGEPRPQRSDRQHARPAFALCVRRDNGRARSPRPADRRGTQFRRRTRVSAGRWRLPGRPCGGSCGAARIRPPSACLPLRRTARWPRSRSRTRRPTGACSWRCGEGGVRPVRRAGLHRLRTRTHRPDADAHRQPAGHRIAGRRRQCVPSGSHAPPGAGRSRCALMGPMRAETAVSRWPPCRRPTGWRSSA